YSINKDVSKKCLVLNSLISHRAELWKMIESGLSGLKDSPASFVDPFGNFAFGVLEEASSDSFIRKMMREPRLLPKEIGDSAVMKFPWNLIEENGRAIGDSFVGGHGINSDGIASIESRGNRIRVSETAEIERFVTLDSRRGPVIIDDNAQVQSFSYITGPCFIGNGSIVKSGRIREGTTIGLNCRVSGEIEKSILSDYANKNHEGFIGHSIIGRWVNLGAMTTNSDLKNTYGNIKVRVGKAQIDTELNKVGVFMGDMAKAAIGTLMTSGKTVGASSQVFGTVLEDVPSFTISAKSLGAKPVEMYLESAIETQKRMMGRRDVQMSQAYE
ncbi:MAG: hypothetical protein ACREBS_03535, partial [Nitrososphaerales archaeon]